MKNKTPPTLVPLIFGLILFVGSVATAQQDETNPPEEPAEELTQEEAVDEPAPTETTGDEQPVVEGSEEDPVETETDSEEQPIVEEIGEDTISTGEVEAEADVDEEAENIQLDSILPTAGRERSFWQVQGLYELHFNVISDEHSANDWYSWYMLRGNFDITDNDQLSLRMDLLQQYIADPGESGLWFGDMRFYYSRSFTVPIPDYPIPAQASLYLTAPTSRSSQQRSYITRPTASVTLAPSLGPLTFITNGFFRYSIASYAESEHGADPNNLFATGFWLQLFYQPFDWFAPSVAWQSAWYLDYPTREGTTQPWLSDYYFEVALNFSIPMPEAAPSLDLSLAYAQGGAVLEGGVFQMYFAKRDQTEIYFGLNLTY